MTNHGTTSPDTAADRVAIRELIDSYAHCADRRDARGQTMLFTPDTHFVVYMDSRSNEPSQDLHGRESLIPVFENLNSYQATMHFNGQSTITLSGSSANGESYCLAHHVSMNNGQRSLMIAAIRYLDVFSKVDGAWYFAERKLLVDWIENRPLS